MAVSTLRQLRAQLRKYDHLVKRVNRPEIVSLRMYLELDPGLIRKVAEAVRRRLR